MPAGKYWVLVVGTPEAATRLATELRILGFPSWSASTRRDLDWVMEQDWMHVAVAIGDLRGCESERSEVLALVGDLAQFKCSRALVVGPRATEMRLFEAGDYWLPTDADTDAIARAATEARCGWCAFEDSETTR